MANLIFLLICYGLGFHITRGHRYSFVFFPSILVLVGAGLAPFWRSGEAAERPLDERLGEMQLPQKFAQVKLLLLSDLSAVELIVIAVICVGFLGSQTIANNLSHLKFYKADQFINWVQDKSEFPAVIGTSTTITDQPVVVGIEIMATAWEVRTQLKASDGAQRWPTAPQFVIAENNAAKGFDADTQLAQSLKTVSRPLTCGC